MTADLGSRSLGPDRARTEVEVTTRGVVRVAWVAVALVLLAVGSLYARARWPGALPLGSDNDEYQLVGRALAAFEPPVVAGVEGTKYPLGYPLVLAVLEWLRLPVAPAALVLNLGAIALTAGLLAWTVGHPGRPGAGLAAGGLVVTSVAVWNDAFSVMPELLTLAVVAGLLTVTAGGLDPPRLAVLVGLAVVAVTLKSLAFLVVGGGSAAVALWAIVRTRGPGWPQPWWRALLPAVVAAGTVLLGMFLLRPFPAHTTGYVATFLLRDPFDASTGTIGLRGLVARTWDGVPETLADLGRAIAFIDASSELAGAVAIVVLTLGVVGAWRLRPGGPLGPFVTGAVLAYVVGLSAWPYHSSRFGLPLVPVAALGLGWVVRAISDRVRDRDRPTARLGVGMAVGALVLAGLVATSFGGAAARGQDAGERLAAQHAAMEELAVWSRSELRDEDRLVSFDYREVARRLDRDVRPLAYTSDPDALWDMVEAADADLVVKVSFHRTRDQQLDLLLSSRPERFEPVLEGDGLGVWRIVP